MNAVYDSLSWADRTMSALTANRLRACEKTLAGLPQLNLFDPALTDMDAETFYHLSWFSEEEPYTELHTLETLRKRTISALPTELSLLSMEEHDLLIRTVLLGGRIPLYSEESYFPAHSLIRRLWGHLEKKGKIYIFTLARQVSLAVLISLTSDENRTIHHKMEEIFSSIDDSLYLFGALPASSAVSEIAQALKGTPAENQRTLYLRALRAAYDTTFVPDGSLVLIHPGLADPLSLFSGHHRFLSQEIFATASYLNDACETLSSVEDPLYDCLMGLIRPLCRPEASAEDTLEDIMILAKQGAGFSDLKEVLSSRIICLPTPEMQSILEDMIRRIPRWSSLRMGQVQ